MAYKDKLTVLSEMAIQLGQAWRHSFDLKCIQNNTNNIKSKDIILFSTLRNESFRIEYFIDYYTKLGVKHFCFVDNGSTDNFMEIVKGRQNCSVWYTEASYKKSKFGMHWLNHLLGKYGSGHWCLTVDPDEFLIYPNIEERNLYELTEFLESEKKENLFCLMLDMYSDKETSQTHCSSGQNPIEAAPYFDSDGYVQHNTSKYWDIFIQGGPRRRVIFKEHPEKAPALNKTPLIKWRWSYTYRSSMHSALPKRLNRAHTHSSIMPTGCLLHFKFLSVLQEKAKEEIERKEHYDDSVEYKKYHKFMGEDEEILYFSGSKKYKNSAQLIELGLMNRGVWF